MRAAVKTGRKRFEIQEIPTPSISADECLVRVHYCAVCVWCYHEWLEDTDHSALGPGISGHEVSGVVEQVGASVTTWHPGDAVLIYDVAGCGTCLSCKAGKTPYCQHTRGIHHGYADYVAAPQSCLLPSPAGIDLKHSGLIGDMLGTPMHAIHRAFEISLPRKVITVWGLGPVGLFAVQALRCFDDVGKIIALDPIHMRRDMALNLGADEVLDPNDPAIETRLNTENAGYGANYAFNCALRNPDDIAKAFRTLSVDGYLMNITGSYSSGFQTEKRVDGSFYFFPCEYEENVRLVQSGKIRLEPILTHEFPAEKINEAMQLRAEHPELSLKVTTCWV